MNEILDFTFRPKSDKRNAKLIVLLLLLFSAGIVAASVISPQYKGVISLLAVISLMVAVYMFVRYVMSDYAYAVINSDGDCPTLIVTRTVGKRVTTLSSLSLTDIKSVEKMTVEPKRERYERKYNFCQSLSPKETFVLRVATRYEKYTMHLEITNEVAERLREYIEIAKSLEPEE